MCLAKGHTRISIFKITFLIIEIFQSSDYVEINGFVLTVAFKQVCYEKTFWWDEITMNIKSSNDLS